MRGITLRRHYVFSPTTAARLGGELAGAGAWDALRDSEPGFSMPPTRDAWRAECGRPELAERGRRIAAIAEEAGSGQLVSYGAGTACVEYQAHLADPGLEIHLSDFGAETVGRLAEVFPEAASADVLDLLTGPVPQRPGALALLHRIDSEFADADLRAVLSRLRDAGHRHVLFVPTMVLTPRVLVAELARRASSRIRRRRATFVGYARSERAFAAIWDGVYAVRSREAAGGAALILLEAA